MQNIQSTQPINVLTSRDVQKQEQPPSTNLLNRLATSCPFTLQGTDVDSSVGEFNFQANLIPTFLFAQINAS